MSQVTPPGSSNPPRSNILFQKRGLAKNIAYQIALSKHRNPDFIVRHPNETKAKNVDWQKEIIKRVTQEESVRQKVLSVRLNKVTGNRRIEG